MPGKGGEGEDTLEHTPNNNQPDLTAHPHSLQIICPHRQEGLGSCRSTHTRQGKETIPKSTIQSMGRTRAPNGSARPVDLIVYEDQKPSLWAKLPDLYKALVLPTLMETDRTHGAQGLILRRPEVSAGFHLITCPPD